MVQVVKNPPAKAGDMGLIPCPGRSHKLQGNQACAPRSLSPCASTPEACALKPTENNSFTKKRAMAMQEKRMNRTVF